MNTKLMNSVESHDDCAVPYLGMCPPWTYNGHALEAAAPRLHRIVVRVVVSDAHREHFANLRAVFAKKRLYQIQIRSDQIRRNFWPIKWTYMTKSAAWYLNNLGTLVCTTE